MFDHLLEAEPEEPTDQDLRYICLSLAAENRVEDECWVEMARRAYDFLTGQEADNVVQFIPDAPLKSV